MNTFKNKQGTIYIDMTKTDGKFNIYVYDYILLRDVFKKTGLSKIKATKILEELKIKYDCFIEI